MCELDMLCMDVSVKVNVCLGQHILFGFRVKKYFEKYKMEIC
jgi:hypothetical protein